MNKRTIWLAVVVFFIFLFHFISRPPHLNYNDAAIYAQIGRNVAEGRGLVTDFIYPEYFRYFPSSDSGKWYSYWPPLHPFCIAAAFLMFGVNDASLISTTAFFFLMSVLLVYLLTKRLFGEKTAFLSALFYSSTQEMLWYSTSGLSEPLFICLLIGTFLLISSARHNRAFILAGLTAGLMAMTRNAALVYLPGFLFFIYLARREKRWYEAAFYFIAGFLLTEIAFQRLIIPLAGGRVPQRGLFWNPFLFNTEVYPGGQIMRTLDTIGLLGIIRYAPFIVKKVFANVSIFLKGLFYFNARLNTWNWIFSLMSPFLLCLFIISIFCKFRDKGQHIFRSAVLFLLCSTLVFHLATITTPEMRYWHPMVPFMIILASFSLIRIFERLPLDPSRKGLYLAVSVVILVWLFLVPEMAKNYFYNRELFKKEKQSVYQKIGNGFKELTRQNDIVVTNVNAWGAWYGRRRCLYYPILPEDIYKLSRYVGIDKILLFSDFYAEPENWEIWEEVFFKNKGIKGSYLLRKTAIKLGKDEYITAVVYQWKD